MKMRKWVLLCGTGVLIVSLMMGCVGYGKLRPLSGQEMVRSIEALEENWGDYAVYWTGLSVGEPSGIMFDPKQDDGRLTNEKWTKVEDEATLAELIGWIKMNRDYYPRLWRIFGPDNRFYGYMYTGWRFVVIKEVDERTLYVHDLPAPLRWSARDDFD